jgi:D-alanine transaminase
MIVCLNGQLVPVERAAVSVLDRGFLFGDGVYEGLRTTRGRVIALDRHIERMRGGLAESRIDFDPIALVEPTRGLLEANNAPDAFVYWQVTRGTPRPGDPVRQRLPSPMTPTVLAYVQPVPALASLRDPVAKSCAVIPDFRWLRGHVKSIALHGNVMAAIEGAEAGCDDVIFVRDGVVAEASSSNVFVLLGGRLVTPSLDSASFLAGVTRSLLLDAMPEIETRVLTERELRQADEVMLAGTLTMIASVTRLDGRPVGSGRPGPGARALLRTLIDACERAATPCDASSAGPLHLGQ